MKHFKQLLNVFEVRCNKMNVTKGFWKALSIIGFHTMFRYLNLHFLFILLSLCPLPLCLHLLLFTRICLHIWHSSTLHYQIFTQEDKPLLPLLSLPLHLYQHQHQHDIQIFQLIYHSDTLTITYLVQCTTNKHPTGKGRGGV